MTVEVAPLTLQRWNSSNLSIFDGKRARAVFLEKPVEGGVSLAFVAPSGVMVGAGGIHPAIDEPGLAVAWLLLPEKPGRYLLPILRLVAVHLERNAARWRLIKSGVFVTTPRGSRIAELMGFEPAAVTPPAWRGAPPMQWFELKPGGVSHHVH